MWNKKGGIVCVLHSAHFNSFTGFSAHWPVVPTWRVECPVFLLAAEHYSQTISVGPEGRLLLIDMPSFLLFICFPLFSCFSSLQKGFIFVELVGPLYSFQNLGHWLIVFRTFHRCFCNHLDPLHRWLAYEPRRCPVGQLYPLPSLATKKLGFDFGHRERLFFFFLDNKSRDAASLESVWKNTHLKTEKWCHLYHSGSLRGRNSWLPFAVKLTRFPSCTGKAQTNSSECLNSACEFAGFYRLLPFPFIISHRKDQKDVRETRLLRRRWASWPRARQLSPPKHYYYYWIIQSHLLNYGR